MSKNRINSKQTAVKLTPVQTFEKPKPFYKKVEVYISLITIGLMTYGFSYQAKQIKIQTQGIELQRKAQEELKNQFEETNKQQQSEFTELKKSNLSNIYHNVLLDLSSETPERRYAGLRSAQPLIIDPEYRESIREAILTAMCNSINKFSENGIDNIDIEHVIKNASISLRTCDECSHLLEIITQLFVTLKKTNNTFDQINSLSKDEQPRRREMINYLRDELGYFLFCTFTNRCANRVDFSNIINGYKTIFDSTSLDDTINRTIDPEALYSLCGYPFTEPDTNNPENSPLIELVTHYDSNCFELIKERACKQRILVPSGTDPNKTTSPGCEILKQVKLIGGGWVGHGIK